MKYKKAPVSLRIDRELKEKLEKKAKEEKRSLANLMTIILEKGVSNV